MCEHFCPSCGKKFSVETEPTTIPYSPATPFEPYAPIPYIPLLPTAPLIPWFQPPFYVGDVIPPQVIVTCETTDTRSE